jgi:hypothetical protein
MSVGSIMNLLNKFNKWVYKSMALFYSMGNKFITESTQIYYRGGMAKWLTILTSNLMVASWIGSNPVMGKSLFPWERKFILIAQY